jgi:hypothetical protein
MAEEKSNPNFWNDLATFSGGDFTEEEFDGKSSFMKALTKGVLYDLIMADEEGAGDGFYGVVLTHAELMVPGSKKKLPTGHSGEIKNYWPFLRDSVWGNMKSRAMNNHTKPQLAYILAKMYTGCAEEHRPWKPLMDKAAAAAQQQATALGAVVTQSAEQKQTMADYEKMGSEVTIPDSSQVEEDEPLTDFQFENIGNIADNAGVPAADSRHSSDGLSKLAYISYLWYGAVRGASCRTVDELIGNIDLAGDERARAGKLWAHMKDTVKEGAAGARDSVPLLKFDPNQQPHVAVLRLMVAMMYSDIDGEESGEEGGGEL